jgi:hypothetical protein
MCCNNMWFYIDMSHCEWAVCGYEGIFGVAFIVVCRFMGTWLHETCSTTIRREIKNTKSDIQLVFLIHTII